MGSLRKPKTSPARARRQSGQATIEFALTMILLFGFVLFFVQVSLVFGWGNYVQYATFMSARSYLAGGADPADQQTRAKNVAVRMLKKPDNAAQDRFPMVARGEGGDEVPGLNLSPFAGQFRADVKESSWMEGVRYTFRSRIFMVPLAGAGSGPTSRDANTVTLSSESVLGREPTYQECIQWMGQFGSLGKDVWIDNGC